MVKYTYIDDSQLLKAFYEAGVDPSSWTKELEAKFKGRFRTRRSKHFYQLRKVIGIATNIPSLVNATPDEFAKMDKDKLRKECQDALPWDVRRHPYDPPFFAADGDPLGGEVLASLIKSWTDIIYPGLKLFQPNLTECPPIEEFVTMCRLVRKTRFVFVFVFVLYLQFFSQMKEWWGPADPTLAPVMKENVNFNQDVGLWHEYVHDSLKKSETVKVKDIMLDLGDSIREEFLEKIMGEVVFPERQPKE